MHLIKNMTFVFQNTLAVVISVAEGLGRKLFYVSLSGYDVNSSMFISLFIVNYIFLLQMTK